MANLVNTTAIKLKFIVEDVKSFVTEFEHDVSGYKITEKK